MKFIYVIINLQDHKLAETRNFGSPVDVCHQFHYENNLIWRFSFRSSTHNKFKTTQHSPFTNWYV